ncbi:M67 family metallopeptidase [Myxococcota bacterium]|nr:M67 family metallopeptidase [Myxococcota bacterium]
MSSLKQRQVQGSGQHLRLSGPAHQAATEHALAGYPHEVVGVLAGSRRDRRVDRAVPLTNRSADRAADRYEVDPLELMKVERTLEAQGLDVLGYYHSHPDHPAMYSDTDQDLAWPDLAYLILSVRGPSPQVEQLRCWRLAEDRTQMLEDHLLLP